MNTHIWVLACFTLAIFHTTFAHNKHVNSPLHKVIGGLRRALEFYHKEGCQVNLDGIFGLRVAEGQLQILVENHGHIQTKNPTLWRTLRVLSKLASKAAQNSMPCLKEKSEVYFNKFKPVIDKPFRLRFLPRHSRVTSLIHKASTHTYNEDKGDKCYEDLMGTSGKPKCTFTTECWDFMTRFQSPDFRHYTATHSLLYFVVIEHIGCKKEMETFLRAHKSTHTIHHESIHTIQQKVCDNIYTEAGQLSKNNHVDIGMQDLYLEEICLCGMMGFEDFVRPDWMTLVLSMQNKQLGCFGYEPPVGGARKLLFDKVLEDGCSSHTSGVGTATLGVYLRVLIDHGGHFPNQKTRIEN